jgi:hypothetical protein
MAEPEVEAAWRAEFKRSGATELRDAVNNGEVDALARCLGEVVVVLRTLRLV